MLCYAKTRSLRMWLQLLSAGQGNGGVINDWPGCQLVATRTVEFCLMDRVRFSLIALLLGAVPMYSWRYVVRFR